MGSSASAASIAIVFVFIVWFRLRAIVLVVGQAHRLPLSGAARRGAPALQILFSWCCWTSLTRDWDKSYFLLGIGDAEGRAGLRVLPLHGFPLARTQPAHRLIL